MEFACRPTRCAHAHVPLAERLGQFFAFGAIIRRDACGFRQAGAGPWRLSRGRRSIRRVQPFNAEAVSPGPGNCRSWVPRYLPTKMTDLEFHVPEAETDRQREPLASVKQQWFAPGSGGRR